MLSHPKVVSVETLLCKLSDLRIKGKVVFTNGCYDILHPGHVDLLAKARALGSSLVLGLNSDASVRMLNKGEDRPINAFEVRAFVLAHLDSVDFITIFDEATPLNLIKAVQPDVLVKGGDWDISKIVGKDVVEDQGGEVLNLPLLEGFSTTDLIAKIRKLG